MLEQLSNSKEYVRSIAVQVNKLLQTSQFAIKTVSSAYQVTLSDGTILGDAGSAGFTITLPDATTCKGQSFQIKKIDTNAATAVSVTTLMGQTIDGSASTNMSFPNLSYTFQSDGVNWRRINYSPDTKRRLFANSGTKTVTNTTTQTSLVPAGVGALTRAPNFFTAGRVVTIGGGGFISIPTGGSINFYVTVNGTVIASAVSAAGLFTAFATQGWNVEADIVCLTTGSSGTMVANGTITVNGVVLELFSTSSVTVDTTISPVIDFQCKWDAATTGRTITTNTFEGETAS